MLIRVKLYARLDRYLPNSSGSDTTRNETDMEVAAGATVADVIARLAMPAEVCHLVLVNGLYVAPGERDRTTLADGDHLAVWPPVAGGAKAENVVVEKEMAVTHADFFRILPGALGTRGYKRSGERVTLADGPRRLVITLGPEGARRIAGLTVPATKVQLAFSGYSDAERTEALSLFERRFQKGGG